jgi:hypothetical protein
MAFTGAATVTSLGKNIARITGLSLGAGASGTIGFAGDVGADVQLPATFPSDETEAGAVDGLTLLDVIRAWYVNDGAAGGAESRHIHVVKTAGPPFRITFTNDNGGAATGEIEIWIETLHTIIR